VTPDERAALRKRYRRADTRAEVERLTVEVNTKRQQLDNAEHVHRQTLSDWAEDHAALDRVRALALYDSLAPVPDGHARHAATYRRGHNDAIRKVRDAIGVKP